MQAPVTDVAALVARRKALHARLSGPVLLAAGCSQSRNFRANTFPFRATSHFLFFVGRHYEGAALLFHEGKTTLFTHPPDPEDALWHGPRPELSELRDGLQLDAVQPLSELDEVLASAGLGHGSSGAGNGGSGNGGSGAGSGGSGNGGAASAGHGGGVATLPTQDAGSAGWLSERLGRAITANGGTELAGADAALADAMVALRSVHDEAALAQLRFAGEVSAQAHVAGMRATRPGGSEHEVVAAMLQVLRAAGLEDAYGPIVTVHGEVLHCFAHGNALADGDLLLADVGGETPEGWAADITRTWPVSGRYSATQRALYDVVLQAQLDCIAAAKPGASYRLVHDTAKRSIVDGLRQLGIFRGEVDGLLERGAAAIFFPHGIGHLIGLDVHDMEDLGDRAGYDPARGRSDDFGDAFLRLDRDLAPGMLVTIEPGFYQVPGILSDEQYTGAVGADLNREELAKYGDVRGIRIEDDVLITAEGNEILTSAVPKEAAAVEALMAEATG